jgi:hypothetical protein
MGVVMSALKYRCPHKSIEVFTAIDTDRSALARLRDLKLAVWCPCCGTGHSIAANKMYFGDEMMPHPSMLAKAS